ncbi:MAG: response regulator [Rhodobacter sp.]|jgi:two-component system chemotaxis response regulator CheY|nr:response regulator [Rhodobacter sp.]MCA3453481.1 response regulator [Rhodobacter sp.]MCA3456200.1 response regulator [Rhodobacter sp.]MCA3461527.1 response regulator [Rhodobacter sp.]MCA3464453.1 response regulator [Rhodobacter sp.]
MSLRETLRVMVVDDMSVSRALISQSLDEIGIKNHVTESDSRAALGKLSANPVHLVISDMHMPGMSGLELLAALRQNRTTQRIGFILITGTPSPEVLRQGQELGLNNLVRKPFTSVTLKSSIERVVGKL